MGIGSCWNGGLCPAHKLEILQCKFLRATHC